MQISHFYDKAAGQLAKKVQKASDQDKSVVVRTHNPGLANL